MRANIYGVSALLKDKTEFTSLDFREILVKAAKNDLVYMDPPYQGVCGDRDSRYFSGIDHEEFIAAIVELNRRQIPYIVSYDGRRREKTFGVLLPEFLELTRIELDAGRSSQATLLGRDEVTFESLYLSPSLTANLNHKPSDYHQLKMRQYALPEPHLEYA